MKDAQNLFANLVVVDFRYRSLAFRERAVSHLVASLLGVSLQSTFKEDKLLEKLL